MLDFKQIKNFVEAPILIQQLFGGASIVAETQLCPFSQATSSVGMTANTIYYNPIYIFRARTITGFWYQQRVQGNYTAGTYNGGALLKADIASGNLTMLAQSTNDGNIWKAAASTFNQKAFSGTVNLTPGMYCLAFYYQSSASVTAPMLSGIGITGGMAGGLGTYPVFGRVAGTPGSSAPISNGSTLSMGTLLNGSAFWGGLY